MKIHPALFIPAVQLGLGVLGLMLGELVFNAPDSGMSFWTGACIAALPQGVFGWWVFRARGARNAKRIANNLFVGEGLKLVLTALLFAAVWSTANWLVAGAIVGGFVAAVVLGQVATAIVSGAQR